MKTKSFTLMIASVFAVVLFSMFASAALTFTSTSTSQNVVAGEDSTITFNFDLDTTVTATSTLTWADNLGTAPFSLSLPNLDSITAGTTESLTASVTFSELDLADHRGDIFNYDIMVTDTATSDTATLSVSITVDDPQYFSCSATSNSSELDLKVEVNNKGEGDDDKWNILDTIEIEVELENEYDSNGDNTYDLRDVTFEIELYEAGTTSNLADDLLWISDDDEEYEFGDIDEGDDGKHTFEFRVDPDQFTDGNYILVVKAFSEDNECIDFSTDLTSGGFGNSAYYAAIDIEAENDKDKMVIVDTETLPKPALASCGQEVGFSADVWNIGDDDFEDQIQVNLYNAELGIDEKVTIQGDLDAGDKAQASFTFMIPQGTEEKTYSLEMRTLYDYDTDDGNYDRSSEDTFILQLKIEGNCAVAQAGFSASLEDGGKAGETLTVKGTITNTGSESGTFNLGLSGYSDWASNVDTDQNSFTLAAGESREVLISFEVKKTAEGTQNFDAEVYADGVSVSTNQVQVDIEGKKGLNWDIDNSALLAILIALIAAVVIAIIIVLIVRAARR